jgi:Nif-specific regulatory protein
MTKRLRSADVELVTIHEISKALQSSLELRKTLRAVVDVLSRNLGVSRAMVTLVTPSGDIDFVASSDAAEDGVAGEGSTRLGRSDDSVAAQATDRRSLIDETADERLCLNASGLHAGESTPSMSLVGVPIRACGRNLGVLSCTRQRGELHGSFQRDVRLLSIVANLIGEAVKLPESTSGEHDHLLPEVQRLH